MKLTSLIAALCALFIAGGVTASYAHPASAVSTKLEKKKPKPATWHKKPKQAI
jgi:hypothetical protein